MMLELDPAEGTCVDCHKEGASDIDVRHTRLSVGGRYIMDEILCGNCRAKMRRLVDSFKFHKTAEPFAKKT